MTNLVSNTQLGQGWSLQLKPNESDRAMPWSVGAEKILQSIYIILDTEPGERLMRPNFGCGLRRHLMEPNTAASRALMQRTVEQSLRKWEPRISLELVSVSAGDDPALVLIDIQYTHRRDGSPGSLVYPFYLG